jgi:hypothetical protein
VTIGDACYIDPAAPSVVWGFFLFFFGVAVIQSCLDLNMNIATSSRLQVHQQEEGL